MTPEGADEPLDSGEWGIFVARAVAEVREEFGEAVANRVAGLLLAQKHDATTAGREQLATTEHLLEQALAELGQARTERDRLRTQLAELEVDIRNARAELETTTHEAERELAARRAEADADIEEANRRLADAWADLRQHESEVATRRAELLRVEDVIGERLAEAESRLIDAENIRTAALADRAEAEEWLERVRSEEAVIELRESSEIRRALEQREHELREWEAELVQRSHEIDLRDDATRRRDAARRYLDDRGDPGSSAGWGRRRRRD